jgi:hypothetical protein
LNIPTARPRGSGFTRGAIWLTTLLFVSGLVTTLLHAQISDADKKKRDAFIKAREEMRTVSSPTPSASSNSGAKPKPSTKKKKKTGNSADDAERAEPVKSPTPKRATAAESDGDSTLKSKSKASPSPSPTRKPSPEDEATPRPTTVPRPTETPIPEPPVRAVPQPTPPPPPPPAADLPTDIVIEKSGMEQEQGFEPPPPPPKRRGFFARLFGGGAPKYRYLDRGVIEAIRQAPVQRARWKFVIVHNSGTRQGNAKAFEYYHRRVRRMQNGMAYHFVVGNGTSSGDGKVEIGDRWRRQINGGHVHSDYLNNISLGICLVGDFNRHQPTRAQLEATEELIRYLRDRCGKADGRTIPVRPHREMNPPRWATDCPGDAFPYGWFRRF